MQDPTDRPPRDVKSRQRSSDSPPPGSEDWATPWVQLRSASYHQFLYQRMVRGSSPDAAPGDLVHVYDKQGDRFGMGFFNPHSQIALRMLCTGETIADNDFFRSTLKRAVDFRHDTLSLPTTTEAYRLVNSEGDGISGLIVDRFADVLSVELYSLGAARQLGSWIPLLHELAGTSRQVIHVDALVQRRERFPTSGSPAWSGIDSQEVRSVRIQENGVRYAVDFASGHKTGFFCDQRENRQRFAELARGRRVMDVCCYTGGFALAALVKGGATEITGVDLDEKAVDQARHNANLNQVRGRWVHSDAFSYLRQMHQNDRSWDAVVVDPPKFIADRDSWEEGRKKYYDLNRLAMDVVEPGGLFVTCSCSGQLHESDFTELVVQAAHRLGRRLQIFARTAASADHPLISNFPEGRYLKAIWCRVW